MVSALALGLASCQQSNFGVDAADNGQMRFCVSGPNGATRVSGDTFEVGDNVGLYVADYANATTPTPLQISGNRANNETLCFDGAKWNTERTIYWGDSKADVYAYYPYFAEVEDVDSQPIAVATDQTVAGAYEASDFLWAKASGVAQTDGAVALAMQHTMSRLVVRIMAGEDYVGSLPADATVHLHSTVTEAFVSLANGSVVKNPYGGAHSIKMRNLGIRSFADGEAVVYEAIVVPQMLEGSVPLIEINSKSVSYLLEDAFNFKPSTSYTYTAVLNTSTTAIKVEIGCEIEDWNNIGGSGSGSGSGSGDDEGGVDLSAYTDLSTEGTANCYMISAAGNYKFKAALGNSDISAGNVKKVEVLWETFGTDVMPNVGDLIAEAGYQNGYVYFSTPETFKDGNASIAVCNSKDVILWSWHIWCATEGWTDQVYANNAGTMMDRNLGATSATPGEVGALGLLYQWGRKDPFLGSSSISEAKETASTGSWSMVSSPSTMSYAEANPTIILNNWKGGNVLGWHTSESEKGLYDPCPVGYRVPDGGDNGFWATANVKATRDSSNRGFHWTLADGETTAWYPACDNEALSNVISVGYCWSATTLLPITTTAYSLGFNYKDSVNPARERALGYEHSVRCVKE